MSVIAKITELDPQHGVLALAHVTIDSVFVFKDVQLLENRRTGEYKIALPSSSNRKSACIEIRDRELNEKIIDAVAAMYKKKVAYKNRFDSFGSTPRNQFVEERIKDNDRKEFVKDLMTNQRLVQSYR